VALALVVLPAGRAWSQAPPRSPAPPPAPAAPPADAPSNADPAKKVEAKAHFEKGFSLLEQGALAAALAEFLISRELYPTRVATFNAATALKKLQRFDESLDMFESLLRDFPTIPPEERTEAQQAIAAMRELVGTLDIKGAEPGAAIIVSGQTRGEYPPISPLRVSAGTHVVRVLKEGFEPFEAKVDVAGGQTAAVPVKLRPMVDSGRLRVVERGGRPLTVIVDGAEKGTAPWEGVLPVSNHAVSLRGKGRIGTAPVVVKIRSKQLSTLTLEAEELDSALRVAPEPMLAQVTIDGVPVGGGGQWVGELKSGKHRVGAALEGYLPEEREIKLERGLVLTVPIKLEVDPKSPMWRKPAHWLIDADAGFVAALPSLGGPAGCTDGCSRSLGAGALGMLHAGYELGNGFGFGLSAGYLFMTQSVTGRTETLSPAGLGPDTVDKSKDARDDLSLSAFLGGIHGSYRAGDKVPFLLRLGAGALVGQARDERYGKFELANGAGSYDVDHALTRALAAYFYADLAVRVGIRIGEHVDLSAGLQGLVMVALSQPKWDSNIELYTGKRPTKAQSTPPTDGVATYKNDPIMGSVVFGLVPALSFRYAF